MSKGLKRGMPGDNCFHLCVDMQRMFAEHTEWHLPWMERVRPTVHALAAHRPDRTIFTRFIPAERPGADTGSWHDYYEHWASMTLERLGKPMVDLVPELASLVPPATVLDKRRYSPWMDGKLQDFLRSRGTDTLIVTGGETEVCVIATILGAVDHGYRVIVVMDALCSSCDAAHDAALRIYNDRFGQQIETVDAEAILRAW